MWAALSASPERPCLCRSRPQLERHHRCLRRCETLLSCQAVDRLDPLKRRTSPDRELVAQGVGDAISGALGGLPVTAVIVRSGANVAAGARERLSAIVHALLLLGCVLFLPNVLNHIPQACLAAVLVQVGLDLAKPSLFAEQRRLGLDQLVPFLITIAAVLATDLLKGVIVGIVVGVIVALRNQAKASIERTNHADGSITLRLRRDGTFIIKPALVEAFAKVPDGARLTFDAHGEPVDQDVREAIAGFVEDAPNRRITASVVGVDLTGASAAGHETAAHATRSRHRLARWRFVSARLALMSAVAAFGLDCASIRACSMSGATIVASDSITNIGVRSVSLSQVIFSLGVAPEYEP